MKRQTFILIFLGTHIVFAGMQIHKQNVFTELSYDLQEKERKKEDLLEKKKSLLHGHYELTNHASIKDYAQNALTMEPITISQIKKIESHDTRI